MTKNEAQNRVIFFELFLVVIVSVGLIWSCSKNPGEPEPIPEPVPAPCDTVFVDVPFPVPFVCDTLDITVQFTVVKDRSAPNHYVIKRGGYPDEPVSVVETSPTPVPFVFTRVFENYLGEAFSIEKVSGSLAEALGIAVVKLECAE